MKEFNENAMKVHIVPANAHEIGLTVVLDVPVLRKDVTAIMSDPELMKNELLVKFFTEFDAFLKGLELVHGSFLTQMNERYASLGGFAEAIRRTKELARSTGMSLEDAAREMAGGVCQCERCTAARQSATKQ